MDKRILARLVFYFFVLALLQGIVVESCERFHCSSDEDCCTKICRHSLCAVSRRGR
uniref:WAP domain-containing protein n=1 Tax=Strigamia maritima TaxID=126957 RepID=T1JG78_STRMM